MTISTLFATVTDFIENLTITGVTIKDFDELSPSWVSTPNILYPNPEGFLTDLRLEYQSFPHGADAKVNILYTLNYRFLGTQIGVGASLLTGYAAMVSKVILIINAIVTNHTAGSGAVEIELGGVTFGAREDPSGNGFHGADIAINVMEMQNV